MDIQYGKKHDEYSYTFSETDLELLISALKLNDRCLSEKLKRIENSPKNNGNAKWQDKKRFAEFLIIFNHDMLHEFISELQNRQPILKVTKNGKT